MRSPTPRGTICSAGFRRVGWARAPMSPPRPYTWPAGRPPTSPARRCTSTAAWRCFRDPKGRPSRSLVLIIGRGGFPYMSLFLAILFAASAAQPPPAAARPRPVACLYDRLDHAYLADLWKRMGAGGIPNDDPILADLNAASLACQQLHGWPEQMVGLAGFYALARAHADAMLREKLPAQADRDLLVRAVQRFAPTHLDILERDGEGG